MRKGLRHISGFLSRREEPPDVLNQIKPSCKRQDGDFIELPSERSPLVLMIVLESFSTDEEPTMATCVCFNGRGVSVACLFPSYSSEIAHRAATLTDTAKEVNRLALSHKIVVL